MAQSEAGHKQVPRRLIKRRHCASGHIPICQRNYKALVIWKAEWEGEPDASRGLHPKSQNSVANFATLLPCKLEYITIYDPRRCSESSNKTKGQSRLLTACLAWARWWPRNELVSVGRLQTLVEVERLFWPGLGWAGLISPRGYYFGSRCMGARTRSLGIRKNPH